MRETSIRRLWNYSNSPRFSEIHVKFAGSPNKNQNARQLTRCKPKIRRHARGFPSLTDRFSEQHNKIGSRRKRHVQRRPGKLLRVEPVHGLPAEHRVRRHDQRPPHARPRPRAAQRPAGARRKRPRRGIGQRLPDDLHGDHVGRERVISLVVPMVCLYEVCVLSVRTAVGIDHIPELIELATKNVMKDNPELLNASRVQFVVGDGRKGYPALGPYKAIHVGAAAPELPQDLVDQLKVSSCSQSTRSSSWCGLV